MRNEDAKISEIIDRLNVIKDELDALAWDLECDRGLFAKSIEGEFKSIHGSFMEFMNKPRSVETRERE